MKNLLVIFLMVLTGCNFNNEKPSETETIENSEASSNEIPTTYYLIRHAEKDRSNSEEEDPILTEQGNIRAEKWSNVFKDIPLDVIFTTKYERTKATAQPTAISKNLELRIYDPNQMYDAEFQMETKGKTALIVGHSNTTPKFVNAILKEEKYEDIPDNENGTLFIVTVHSDKSVSSQVLHID